MTTELNAYRAAVAAAPMQDHRCHWHAAFETPEATSATFMVEGGGPELAKLPWDRYTTRAAAYAHDESALQDWRSAA